MTRIRTSSASPTRSSFKSVTACDSCSLIAVALKRRGPGAQTNQIVHFDLRELNVDRMQSCGRIWGKSEARRPRTAATMPAVRVGDRLFRPSWKVAILYPCTDPAGHNIKSRRFCEWCFRAGKKTRTRSGIVAIRKGRRTRPISRPEIVFLRVPR